MSRWKKAALYLFGGLAVVDTLVSLVGAIPLAAVLGTLLLLLDGLGFAIAIAGAYLVTALVLFLLLYVARRQWEKHVVQTVTEEIGKAKEDIFSRVGALEKEFHSAKYRRVEPAREAEFEERIRKLRESPRISVGTAIGTIIADLLREHWEKKP